MGLGGVVNLWTRNNCPRGPWEGTSERDQDWSRVGWVFKLHARATARAVSLVFMTLSSDPTETLRPVWANQSTWHTLKCGEAVKRRLGQATSCATRHRFKNASSELYTRPQWLLNARFGRVSNKTGPRLKTQDSHFWRHSVNHSILVLLFDNGSVHAVYELLDGAH